MLGRVKFLIYLFICLFIYLIFVYLFVCLFIYLIFVQIFINFNIHMYLFIWALCVFIYIQY